MKINEQVFVGKRVLITGAYGFLGRHLTAALYGIGAEVFAVMNQTDPSQWPVFEDPDDDWRNSCRTIQADLTNRDSVRQMLAVAQPDFIFHLAAISQVTEAQYVPDLTWNINVMGTVNLMRAITEMDFERPVVIFASSDKFYGNTPESADENTTSMAVHPYDSSKAAMEMAIHSFANYYQDFNYSIIRCVNIFGQGDFNYKRIIPDAIRQCYMNNTFKLRGDGSSCRQYVFVNNVVSAYLKVAELVFTYAIDSGEIFNLGGFELLAYDLVELIYKNMGYPHAYIQTSSSSRTKESVYNRVDDSKARKILGWEGGVLFKQHLKITIDWYIKQFKKYGVS